jgi:hypothetical protein
MAASPEGLSSMELVSLVFYTNFARKVIGADTYVASYMCAETRVSSRKVAAMLDRSQPNLAFREILVIGPSTKF